MYLLFGRRKLLRRGAALVGEQLHGESLGGGSDREFRTCRPLLRRVSACIRTATNRRLHCSPPCRERAVAAGHLHVYFRRRRFRPRSDATHDGARASRSASAAALDGVGAIQLPRSCFKAIRSSAGIETAHFQPLARTQDPGSAQFAQSSQDGDRRRQRGSGRAAAISQRSISSGVKGATPWRDLTFDLQGQVAAAAAAQFEADWVAAGGKPAFGRGRLRRSAAASRAGPHAGWQAQFLPSGPDQAEDTVHALLIDACFQARERMLAVTPYFVPDVEPGNGNAPGCAAWRANRPCHSRESRITLGGFRTQPGAARVEQRRRPHSSAALHDATQRRWCSTTLSPFPVR